MKEKIMYLIVGILIGAIISTIGFYFYNKNHTANTQKVDGNRPQMMDGRGPRNGNFNKSLDGENTSEKTDINIDGENPPEKPDGTFEGQTPPEKPQETSESQSSEDKSNDTTSTNQTSGSQNNAADNNITSNISENS